MTSNKSAAQQLVALCKEKNIKEAVISPGPRNMRRWSLPLLPIRILSASTSPMNAPPRLLRRVDDIRGNI